MRNSVHNSRFDSHYLDLRFTETELPSYSRVRQGEGRDDWVNAQLARTFMTNSRSSLLMAVFTLPVIVFMLYGVVSTVWLGLWALGIAGLSALRFRTLARFNNEVAHTSSEQIQDFFLRHRWSWPASAFLWAVLMFLYLNRVPLSSQFICMLVLVGMGSFSVTLMSARLDCFVPYTHALSLTCLVAVATSWLLSGSWVPQSYDLAIFILTAVFWRLVLTAGQRFHTIQRRGFELQYDNEILIGSLREQTEMAMQAVTVKKNLLANAAHDLRQPVHALAFYADWLRNEPDLAAEVVPKILTATDSVNTLFNSLFDFAKIEAGGVQPQFRSVPVCEIVNDLTVQFSPSAGVKNIDFRQRITPGYVWTDPVLIRRIVGNLVANAIRYTDHGGVLLCTRVHGRRMWIEVWDTGVGIAPEHQLKVFGEFYKAPTHAGTEDGFGLGLAIVQRLTTALEHGISMVSRPGRGTRMRVELDLCSPPDPDSRPVSRW
jgi:signal transduction histidine kinase